MLLLVSIHFYLHQPWWSVTDVPGAIITLSQFSSFHKGLSKALCISVKDDNGGEEDCCIEFTSLSENIWKLASSNGRPENSILIQKISLLNLERLRHIILNELHLRTNGFSEVVENLRVETEGMNDIEILHYLHNEYFNTVTGSLRYNIIIDLLTDKDYLTTLPKYNEEFYNRYVKAV